MCIAVPTQAGTLSVTTDATGYLRFGKHPPGQHMSFTDLRVSSVDTAFTSLTAVLPVVHRRGSDSKFSVGAHGSPSSRDAVKRDGLVPRSVPSICTLL